MIIEKVINNNVISTFDNENHEVIMMGRGIGFKKRSGDIVDENQIEKKYILNSEDEVGRFAELLKSLPVEHLRVSTDIINYAKQVIKGDLNHNIYITLTDHIHFAIERYRGGVMFQNALIQEARTFYPSEFVVGEYAIALIAKRLKVELPIDEAASVALHLVNAEGNDSMGETLKMTSLIQEVIRIVENDFHDHLNETGLHYSRFVTHIKYLAQRIFTKKMLDSHDYGFIDMLIQLYPHEYECSKKIGEYIYKQYGCSVLREELAYLTVHIKRIQTNV